MKVTTTIELEIDGQKLTLSMAQAKALKQELERIVPADITYISYPSTPYRYEPGDSGTPNTWPVITYSVGSGG